MLALQYRDMPRLWNRTYKLINVCAIQTFVSMLNLQGHIVKIVLWPALNLSDNKTEFCAGISFVISTKMKKFQHNMC
jgi:hypothetical protein